MSNHLSHLDPLTLAHFVDSGGRAPRFLGKSELFELPVVGRVAHAAGQIPVYRDTVDAATALRAAIQSVNSGECVVIYPEGTLTRDQHLWPMAGKTGAARIGLSTGCPVIPVAQWGPQQVLAPGHRVPRLLPRALVQIRAGRPVDLQNFSRQRLSSDVLRAATAAIMNSVVLLLEQLRGQDGESH